MGAPPAPCTHGAGVGVLRARPPRRLQERFRWETPRRLAGANAPATLHMPSARYLLSSRFAPNKKAVTQVTAFVCLLFSLVLQHYPDTIYLGIKCQEYISIFAFTQGYAVAKIAVPKPPVDRTG